jgi:hypothetical protein
MAPLSSSPRWLVVSFAVLLASAWAFTAGKGSAFKMKQVQVVDQAGFGKPVPAADLLIPADWQFQSKVQWGNRGCFPDLAAVSFLARSPDGKLAFEAFPSFTWQYANSPAVQKYLVMENQQGQQTGLKPCPVNPPIPAAEVLKRVVLPKYRPGKEPVSFEPLPDIQQLIGNRAQALGQQASRGGQPVQFQGDSARARLKYDLDGKPVEEWITAVSVAEATTISTGSGATQGINCRAVMLYAMRAPQGQLGANEALFRMIRASLRWEPEWQRQYIGMVDHLTEFQQNQRQIRAQMIRQFQQHEVEVINGVVANRARGMNQTVVGADELIRGVEPYRDPATGKTYELSSLYGNAWTNGNNEFVLSDDPNLNPSSLFNGDWKPLDHVQRQP